MLIWRAGGAPPAGPGIRTSVFTAMRFHAVTAFTTGSPCAGADTPLSTKTIARTAEIATRMDLKMTSLKRALVRQARIVRLQAVPGGTVGSQAGVVAFRPATFRVSTPPRMGRSSLRWRTNRHPRLLFACAGASPARAIGSVGFHPTWREPSVCERPPTACDRRGRCSSRSTPPRRPRPRRHPSRCAGSSACGPLDARMVVAANVRSSTPPGREITPYRGT